MSPIRTAVPSSLPGLVVRSGETVVCLVSPEDAERGILADVRVEADAAFFFRSLALAASNIAIRVRIEGEGGRCDLRAAVVGTATGKSSLDFDADCRADSAAATLRIAAFAPDGANVETRASASVGASFRGCEVESVQSNVFLGNGGHIRGMPELKIAAADVKARHACAVERISEESLFFLRSRGLSEHDATASVLAAKVSEIFSGLPEGFVHEGETLCARAMKMIVP